jgi:hypothetical protein
VTYSTVHDVRNFGVSPEQASDAKVAMGLAVAKVKINKYCGVDTDFGTLVTKTVIKDDVASADVALPPFTSGSISAVTISDIALGTTDWEERPFGIRLARGRLFDIDGFLLFPDSPISNSAFRQRGSVKVTVTGEFGTAIDELLSFASTILASGIAMQTADDNMLPAQIKMFMSEEIKTMQGRVEGSTTGNLEVDAMLDNYLDGGAMIG